MSLFRIEIAYPQWTLGPFLHLYQVVVKNPSPLHSDGRKKRAGSKPALSQKQGECLQKNADCHGQVQALQHDGQARGAGQIR